MAGKRDGTLHIRVKVIPRAGKTCFRGRMADGTIKIALRSPPADGKANRELIRFLADEFRTVSSAVEIVSGATSRRKLVRIEGFRAIPDWLRG